MHTGKKGGFLVIRSEVYARDSVNEAWEKVLWFSNIISYCFKCRRFPVNPVSLGEVGWAKAVFKMWLDGE
jgi:hypothetical protein